VQTGSENTEKYRKIQFNNELNETDKKVLIGKLENKQNKQIAKELKKTEKHISIICNKPEFKKAYNELTTEITKSKIERIEEVWHEAFSIYVNLMRSANSEFVRKGVCENLLGFEKVEKPKHELPDNLDNLSDNEIHELYKQLKSE